MVDWRIEKSDCSIFQLLNITLAVYFPTLHLFISSSQIQAKSPVLHFVCVQNNLCFSILVHVDQPLLLIFTRIFLI